jgi:prephenate dehydrogenase
VVESLDVYIKHLNDFKDSLIESDDSRMYQLMRNANRLREILNGKTTNLVRKESKTTKLFKK